MINDVENINPLSKACYAFILPGYEDLANSLIGDTDEGIVTPCYRKQRRYQRNKDFFGIALPA